MSVDEASSEETPYGRWITSDGWFVLNLADALAVRNEEKGGATYHAEGEQEGFLVLAGECLLIVEEEERPLRQWDYFHCPANTRHVIVGAGDEPCTVLMIGARREVETLHYPVSEVAAKHGASVAEATDDGDEAYAGWPGAYVPVRLPWPPGR